MRSLTQEWGCSSDGLSHESGVGSNAGLSQESGVGCNAGLSQETRAGSNEGISQESGAGRGTSLIRKRVSLGPYSRLMPMVLRRSWGGGVFL